MCICTLLDVEVKELLGYTPRTKNTILRDIIGNNPDFQKEQAELLKEGKDIKDCEELYQKKYKEYKAIFGFEN